MCQVVLDAFETRLVGAAVKQPESREDREELAEAHQRELKIAMDELLLE